MKTQNGSKIKISRWTLAGLIGFSVFVNLARATTHYVDVNSGTPTPPYTNWATAATLIQDAVGAAVPSDNLVGPDQIDLRWLPTKLPTRQTAGQEQGVSFQMHLLQNLVKPLLGTHWV